MGKREKLIGKLIEIYDRGNTLPAVPIAEFFDTNRDPQSIAVNLCEEHPGLATFRRVPEGIVNRRDVQCVLAEIMDCPDPNEPLDKDEWPNLVHRGWNVRRGVATPMRPTDMSPGMRVVRVWWD